MASGSDFRKMLDELQLNRLSIESDRKSYEAARSEILKADENLGRMSDQLTSLLKKKAELGNLIAVRLSDIRLINIKITVLREACDSMENLSETKRNDYLKVKQRLREDSSNTLQKHRLFCQEWNCSELGFKYRQDSQADKIQGMKSFQQNLASELKEFLRAQQNLQFAEIDKFQMEEKYKTSVKTLKLTAGKVQMNLESTESTLASLNAKRNQLAGNSGFLQRIVQEMDKTRDSISFWEGRVSESQRMLRKQRYHDSGTGEGNCKKPATELQMRYPRGPPTLIQNRQEKIQGRPTLCEMKTPHIESNRKNMIAAYNSHRVTKTSQKEQNNKNENTRQGNDSFETEMVHQSSNDEEESEYSFAGTSKGSRMFQFKRKSNADTDKA